MTTQQDNLELAKECGAVIDPNLIMFWPGEFHVFCDRIRQQERDTIVGLQAIIERKNAALFNILHPANMGGSTAWLDANKDAKEALALTSSTDALEAVRAEHMGKMAMLVRILETIELVLKDGMSPSDILDENSPIRDAIRESVSATSAEVKAFMDRHYAEVLEAVADKFSGKIKHQFVAADGYTNGADIAEELYSMAAELRNSGASEKGKEGETNA